MNGAESRVAALAAAGIASHLLLRFLLRAAPLACAIPLWIVLLAGAPPLLLSVARKLARRELGADLLAGVAILAAALMDQELVAAILVLMLAGGGTLEALAARRASAVLAALARRMPRTARRKTPNGFQEIPADDVAVGDVLVVLPHEICPADGIVVEGHGGMNEAYLTGEPFHIAKAPGSRVLAGAVNGESALTIEARALRGDSRYAAVMRVMEQAELARPALRRLGDQLAMGYVPFVLAAAAAAGWAAGDPTRALSVLVVATPCPLLIAIPVAVIGAVSLAAARGIIVKDPVVLERVARCRTLLLDKTGTVTLGKPSLTEIVATPGESGARAVEVLRAAASLERYSRHPLAGAIVEAAERDGLSLPHVSQVRETPGRGLEGWVDGRHVRVTGRKLLSESARRDLPPPAAGLECVVLVDGAPAATFRFRDAPRPESRPFLSHLVPAHGVGKIMLVSGDRESEVRWLADEVGVTELAAGVTPEEKLAIVVEETKKAPTLFVGDGINDAPALAAAHVGIAMGRNNDVVSEAAGAVILAASLGKLDELIHIGARMRRVALQSAVGGMALSLAGMALAAAGGLPPLAGAIAQEIIDLAAILNALRAALPPKPLTDF